MPRQLITRRLGPALAVAAAMVACSSGPARKAGSCDGPCPASKIDHVVVIVQENHSFDTYFAKYCTAATGSAPTCTSGPGCCEAGPAMDPSGAQPIVLDDTANAARDPNHTKDCETMETDGGLMDKYVTGAGDCSDPGNFAYADASTVQPYWDLATGGALADHYFQPIVGQSSANDMYLVRAQFVFDDNDDEPPAIGAKCSLTGMQMNFQGPIIGDLLDSAKVSWAWYVEGYQEMVDATMNGGPCPRDKACAAGIPSYPCVFDPGDLPIDFYSEYTDNPRVIRDFTKLAGDLASGTLPQVVFVRAIGYRSEHPGLGTTVSQGVTWTQSVVDAVANSDYAPDTLVLLTWDEGGGFFDHVAPPGMGSDGQPYGTRVPLVAIGPMAAVGTISHVQMEHSSIVKFVEWNWLGGAAGTTGQLAGRDVVVANLGSMLDASKTGVVVPP